MSIADAADALRLLVAGDQVMTFNEAGEQYEVHLRAQELNRSSTDAIAGLPVPSSRLGIVSLDNIATFARDDSPATISRMGRQRQVTVTANMLPGTSQGSAQAQIAAAAAKKNSILQIDHANQLREAGMSTHDAVVQASRDRLRPILMTTLAFVAGMIPLVVSQGVGSATNHAIGWVVIGGQTMVLLVTLLVTPVAYSLFDQAQQAQVFKRTVAQLKSAYTTQA